MDYRSYDTRLAAYAVVVDDRGQILLALWNEGPEPRWTMPGGGVELEETPQQATVRELREETGYDVRLGPLLTVHTEVERARPDGSARPHKSVRVVFEAEVVGGSSPPRSAAPRTRPAGSRSPRSPTCDAPRSWTWP